MDNIVIDTNCLIMAISSRSLYHKIWQSFLVGDYCLCISNEILEEYAEVIARVHRGTVPVCTRVQFPCTPQNHFFVEMLCHFIFYAYLCNQQQRQ